LGENDHRSHAAVKRRSVSVLMGAAVVAAFSCADPAGKLPDYGRVPHFAMTDSQGRSFDSNRLAGRVWAVDFIYTSCPGPCPRMTSEMHRVEQQVKDDADVVLISISVDPEHDSPPVLNDFAHKFGGPANNWYFLAGTPATVHLLAHDTFKVGDVISNMDHSTKFMLVDKHGNLRGYYSSEEADGIASLVRDIAALRRQKS